MDGNGLLSQGQVVVVLRDPIGDDADLLLPHIPEPLWVFAGRVPQVYMVSPCKMLTHFNNFFRLKFFLTYSIGV